MKKIIVLSSISLFLAASLLLRAEETNSATPVSAGDAPLETDASPPDASREANHPDAAASLLRDPFWPVGYVPSNPSPVRVVLPSGDIVEPSNPDIPPPPPKEPQWEAARKMLKIQGISRVGRERKTGLPIFFAVINGRVMEEGGIVEVVTPDFKYRWKVAAIAEKNVKLNPLDVQSR